MAPNVIWWQANGSTLPSDLFTLPGPITIAPISSELYQLHWVSPKGACSLGPLPGPLFEPHQGQTKTSNASLTTPAGTIRLSSVILEQIDLLLQPQPQMQLYICNLFTDDVSANSGQFIAQASTSGPPPDEG